MMTIAWQHNPQTSIHDASGISWGYWVGIGASWALPIFVLAFAAVYLVVRLLRWLVPDDAV